MQWSPWTSSVCYMMPLHARIVTNPILSCELDGTQHKVLQKYCLVNPWLFLNPARVTHQLSDGRYFRTPVQDISRRFPIGSWHQPVMLASLYKCTDSDLLAHLQLPALFEEIRCPKTLMFGRLSEIGPSQAAITFGSRRRPPSLTWA